MIIVNDINDLISYIMKKLRGNKLTLLSTDLDGTLTLDRNSYRLDLEAVRILRELNAIDMHV